MGMNMTEKILAKHAGLDKVVPGQLITCKLDMVLANDVTAPPSIKEFEKTMRDLQTGIASTEIQDNYGLLEQLWGDAETLDYKE